MMVEGPILLPISNTGTPDNFILFRMHENCTEIEQFKFTDERAIINCFVPVSQSNSLGMPDP